MEVTINAYQRSIELLLSWGYRVIQIFPFRDTPTAYYYVVNKFTPAMQTPTEDIRYNQVIGVNVTDFLANNPATDPTVFRHRLDTLLGDARTVRVEFPNSVAWFKFGSEK